MVSVRRRPSLSLTAAGAVSAPRRSLLLRPHACGPPAAAPLASLSLAQHARRCTDPGLHAGALIEPSPPGCARCSAERLRLGEARGPRSAIGGRRASRPARTAMRYHVIEGAMLSSGIDESFSAARGLVLVAARSEMEFVAEEINPHAQPMFSCRPRWTLEVRR